VTIGHHSFEKRFNSLAILCQEDFPLPAEEGFIACPTLRLPWLDICFGILGSDGVLLLDRLGTALRRSLLLGLWRLAREPDSSLGPEPERRLVESGLFRAATARACYQELASTKLRRPK